MKKLLFFALLVGGGITTILFSSNNNPNDPQAFYYAQPPIPLEYTVQKLAQPLDGGENMILRVQFVEDIAMQNHLNIYQNGSVAMTLKDDGTYPDAVAGDYKYAAYIQQDVSAFITEIKSREAIIAQQGYVRHFTGHASKILNANEVVLFDEVRFNNNLETGINPYIFDVGMCETELKKENSLFITDLSVVENPSNTFNVVTGQGNPVGAWTFGSMMMRMCNPAVTGLDPKEFLKEWVKQGRMSREYISQFIRPWIINARRKSGTPNYVSDTSNNWELGWDSVDVNALYRYAPFKLTAIVNRLDLHGNLAYGGTFFNAGETRFIFTHINPLDDTVLASFIGVRAKPGHPLMHGNIDFFQATNDLPGASGSITREDWRGMNIILEYQNVQRNKCELKAFAQQWANLSTMTLGSSQYIAALTTITNTVTNYNSLPGTPNNSAIARIRSNEKCFAHVPGPGQEAWTNANWEFRQMELDASTHMFELAPLTNTPKDIYNITNANSIILFNPGVTSSSTGGSLLQWANASAIQRNRILNGNHIMPVLLPNTQFDLLAFGHAEIDGEAVHYLDFDSFEYPTAGLTDDSVAKELRHQLSLNTCQGCHAGETKTVFTQIRPIAYGENADYWSAIPDYIKGYFNPDSNKYFTDFDMRETFGTDIFYYTITNGGMGNRNFTKDHNSDSVNNYKLNYINSYPFQVVSPFLTGRVYNGKINGVDNWDDDNTDPGELDNDNQNQVFFDNKITGDFFINDPSNKFQFSVPSEGPFPGLSNWQNRFNDLEMRKAKLCDLLDKNCNNVLSVTDIIQEIGHIPFPLGAH